MRLRSGKAVDEFGNDAGTSSRSPSANSTRKSSESPRRKAKNSDKNTPPPSNASNTTNGVVSKSVGSHVNNDSSHHKHKDITHQYGSANAENDNGMRPHGWWAMLLLKLICAFFIGMYFIVPVILKLNPWILTEATFLHRFSWPPFINLSRPEELGLNSTHSFTIEHGDLTLGLWHTLPPEVVHGMTQTSQLYEAQLKSGPPIVLYLHGIAGTRAANHRRQLYTKLSQSNYQVISLDYRGFGDSTGYPSEGGVVEDSYATYQWIKQRSGNTSVYIWGHSLGTAIATKLAQRLCNEKIEPSALILEAPFTSVAEAAMSFPTTTPFRIMPYFTWVFIESLKQQDIIFETDKNILDVTVPILILHAMDDPLVPYEHGEKLYQLVQEHKHKVVLHSFDASDGYGHKHIHKAPELITVLSNFLKKMQI